MSHTFQTPKFQPNRSKSQQSSEPLEISQGIRGPEFKLFITRLLQIGNINNSHISFLTNDENMKLYSIAFTHQSANDTHNYECYEILGDATLNSCIVWYLARKYPNLLTPDGVKIIARQKINLVSKKSFSTLAIGLDIWKFVSADVQVKQTKMKKVSEDVFEAFFGVTNLLADQYHMGIGNEMCYRIISAIFDENVNISFKYEDMFDNKTRLKELFDANKQLGELVYTNEKVQTATSFINVSSACIKMHNGQLEVIGVGKAALKIDAEQNAAGNAIDKLNKRGICKIFR